MSLSVVRKSDTVEGYEPKRPRGKEVVAFKTTAIDETKSKYLNTFQGVPPLVNPFQKITFNATSAISHNSFTLDRRQSLGIQAIANGSVLINTDPFQINPIPISTTIQYDRLIAQMST